MPEPLDRRERRELCDLLTELGPDAPTMCDGWTTADLAAHLVVRDRDPLGAPGIVVGWAPLARLTERRMATRLEAGYDAVVDAVRAGPLRLLRTAALGRVVNLGEYFVHHEDVRRANGRSRRDDRPDLDEALWDALPTAGRLTTRRLRKVGLVVARPDGTTRRIRKGVETVTLSGPPSELFLYLHGRRDVAQVVVDGPPQAAAALRGARLGL